MRNDSLDAIEHIVRYCGNLMTNEKVVILFDVKTMPIAEKFKETALKYSRQVKAIELAFFNTHGIEPPFVVKSEMMAADLIICLTFSSLAHTNARLEAAQNNARFLSLPQYTFDLLNDAALCFPYKDSIDLMEEIAKVFDRGKCIKVTSSAGTILSLDIDGRVGNCCPGIVNKTYKLGSPPNAEVNIAPIEDKSQGRIVVDGSITCMEIGLLREEVVLSIVNGKLENIYSKNKNYVEVLTKIFDRVGSDKAYYLAECGIGFNAQATLCGNMLIDEGCFGCVHFGFGSNSTINGVNEVNFHLDFVIQSPTLQVDNRYILKEGILQNEYCNAKL